MVVEGHLFGEGIVVWCCRLFLFAGCLFVAGNVAEVASLASSQKAAILLDKEGKSLSIEAGKAELPAKFAQLLRL